MDKLDKKNILQTYFGVVHDLENPQYLVRQWFHSELYSGLNDEHWVWMMSPVISKNKDIPISYTRLNFDDLVVYTPENITETILFYTQGKNICASSYSIREQYFNNCGGWYDKTILTQDEEKLLIEIERKITPLEFINRIQFYVDSTTGIHLNTSNQDIFKILFKRFLTIMRKRSKDGRFLYELVKMFSPHFSINIYGVIDYALNEVADEEFSNMIYTQIKKEISLAHGLL